MDRSWLKAWIAALLACALLVGGYEWLLRSRGYAPTVQDDMDLWSMQYDRLKLSRDAVALLGASRIAFGVDPALLLDTLSKGSADSFALRNHGLKAIVPGNFPERAFSTEYALKDLSYALELAGDAGIKIRGAELVGKILQEAIDAGSGEAYFPVIAKHIGGG